MLQKSILIIALISSFACASKKGKKEIVAKEIVKKTVVISFISRGTGTNSALYAKTKEFLDKKVADSSCNTSFQIKPWGREGERDVCLETNSKCYDDLLKEIQSLIASDDRVQIKENQICRETKTQ